ncbi:UNVERIFIED_CONTAM: rhoptry protein ROP4 [Hammondia hammondi]|eukprot:XP_008886844.1 rhoptry protein ROP4 [Hammondia hammondi]
MQYVCGYPIWVRIHNRIPFFGVPQAVRQRGSLIYKLINPSAEDRVLPLQAVATPECREVEEEQSAASPLYSGDGTLTGGDDDTPALDTPEREEGGYGAEGAPMGDPRGEPTRHLILLVFCLPKKSILLLVFWDTAFNGIPY